MSSDAGTAGCGVWRTGEPSGGRPRPAGAGAEVAVAARGVSKCYEIYARPIDRLKQTLLRGRRQYYREFWALRDVSFEIRRGESIGIIGRNGSGKSTLLQIIAGTLRPTEGEVEIRGRVAALLELGSGFNPDFTGRENVYLNGAILGLSSEQVDARFDDIAAFADIGDFIQMPVKTYSTGMLVRLAFAVQAVLEPDVLIVDEALSVGDAAFQIKCMKRMHALIDRGVSVILVTHDVNSVRTFCHRAIWLDQGRLMASGDPADVTTGYMRFLFGTSSPDAGGRREAIQSVAALSAPSVEGNGQAAPRLGDPRPLAPVEGRPGMTRWGSGDVMVEGFAMDNGAPGSPPAFEHGERLHIEMQIVAVRDVASENLCVAFAMRNPKALAIVTYTSWDAGLRLPPMKAGDRLRARFELANILAPGEYSLVLVAEEVRGQERHYFDYVENVLLFRVLTARRIFSVVLPEVEVGLITSPAAERSGHADTGG